MKIDVEVNNPNHPEIQHVLLKDHKTVLPGKRRRVAYCGLTWDDGFSWIAEHRLNTREQRQVRAMLKRKLGAAKSVDEGTDSSGE